MSASLVRAVSLFTDFLEFDVGIPDLEEIEPEEIRALCEDPIFRKVAEYCLASRNRPCSDRRPSMAADDSAFDRDELGIDPEEDAPDAATDV